MPQNVTMPQRHTLQIKEISKIFREDMSLLKRLLVAMVSDLYQFPVQIKRLQPECTHGSRNWCATHALHHLQLFFRGAVRFCSAFLQHVYQLVLFVLKMTSHLLDRFLPFRISGKGACVGGWEGSPLDRSPVHCRALCKYLWVPCLAQGYLSIALKMSWHLPLLECLACFVHTGA